MENKYTRLKWLALIIIAGFLFFLAQTAMAGNKALGSTTLIQQEITGKVTNKGGVPLVGVTVMVKESNTGTITNLEGIFQLPVPQNSMVVFSFIGYKTLEVPFNGEEELNVTLEEDITSLGEVEINAGYYSTTRRKSTGNISRVTAKEIELQPVISPLQALQGRMAGVEIIPGGDQPGMAPTIRIRGRNSLREDGNLPLYIINGVPFNSSPIESNSLLGNTGIDPLNTLNVSNIESIEVLKDADATAIYGSRGANGVVLITTKKGSYGKPGLEARVYTGASKVPNRLDLLNTNQYLQIRKQAFINDGVEPDQFNAYDLVLWDQDRYTDWQEFFYGGTAAINDVNLSTSGGDENTSFRLGGSYHSQGTVYPGDFDYNKVTASLNLNHATENKKLHIDLSVNYGLDNNNLVGFTDLSFSAFYLPPNAPKLFNEDGSLYWDDWAEAGLNNPLEGFFNTSTTRANNLVSSLGLAYELVPGLTMKANSGYTNFSSSEILKKPKRSYNPAYWESIENASTNLDVSRKSWIIEPQLQYSTKAGKGNLDAIIGGTFQESNYKSLGLEGQGYVSESLIGNLSAAESITNAVNQNTTYRYTAIFGRLGVNWDKKYYLNLTGRRDGSSRFGSGNRFANFGALGGAWIFSEESFFKNNLSFLNLGKLRGSYGTTGNDQIGDYGYLDSYEATIGPGGLYPTQLANPDYSWEINKKLEAAIEFAFLDNRLDLSLSWYRNRSSNQLVGYTLPAITGFNSIQANLPATVENTGLELELSSINFRSKDFNWQTFLNITIPKNKLVSYPGIEQSSYANVFRVGHPLNISLLYQYEGLDPETGYYNVADINEDGVDYEDKIVIQDFGRKFFGGISNNLSYKNFTLNFLWEFVKQEGSVSFLNPGNLSNQQEEVIQAFKPSSRFQRISQSYEASVAYFDALESNFPLQDASFLRLKTFSIGYSFPSDFVQGIGLRDGKVFLNGQNLWTLTKYKGMDPEVPIGGTQFAGLQTITGGIQINF
tara:strand:- start:16194 stop:19193 length:3000 start_codon:yes stop_codon:yes gene_type:complete